MQAKIKITIFFPTTKTHCVKSVRIRSYSGPFFSCIQTEYGKRISLIFCNMQYQKIFELISNNWKNLFRLLLKPV